MEHNIYDDPEFLAGYTTLSRQVDGLAGAAEWPAMRAMVSDVASQRVADLGCGFGWFSRWAVEQGAGAVVGIDGSISMLNRARAQTKAGDVEYRCVDLNFLDLGPQTLDLVFSSLTLHYVLDLSALFLTIANALVDGGRIVFSVEHPIYSAPSSQNFETSVSGKRIWPLENYLEEGERVTTWFVDGVVKQHRTIATYVNALIRSGLVIDQIDEWGPTADEVAARPELVDDRHRPWFLLVAATRMR